MEENEIFKLAESLLNELDKGLLRNNKNLHIEAYTTSANDEKESNDNYYTFFTINEIWNWKFYILWNKKVRNETNTPKEWRFYACCGGANPSIGELDKNSISFNYVAGENDCDARIFARNILSIMLFIYNEPELAFCRAHYRWDYNLEYHNREDAKKLYQEYIESLDKASTIIEQNNSEILRTFKNYFKDKYAGFFGDGSYVIRVKQSFFKKGTPLGTYYIGDIDDKEFFKLYTEKFNECCERAKKYKIDWKSPYFEYIEIVA